MNSDTKRVRRTKFLGFQAPLELTRMIERAAAKEQRTVASWIRLRLSEILGYKAEN